MLATVYVRLLDEGVDVWRPVDAEDLGGGRYRLPAGGLSTSDETWEFAPGTTIECDLIHLGDGEVLVASRAV